jgi:hypothetical protein
MKVGGRGRKDVEEEEEIKETAMWKSVTYEEIKS